MSRTKKRLPVGNVIKLVAMLMMPQGKERVHPKEGALVQQKGHDEKTDQGICKKKTIQTGRFMLLYR